MMTLSQIIIYFAIYSFLGWVWETVYLFFYYKKFIDTGFLKGPFCPLYGICSILAIILLSPFQQNFLLFYVLAIVIATVLEYFTSLIFEAIFKIKFWEYSAKPNFQGRISLWVSLFWGILLFTLVKFIHPQIIHLYNSIPISIINFLTITFPIYFLIDFIYTTISLFRLKNILKSTQLMSDINTLLYRRQIQFFKSFPKISSKKFNLVKEISQKINR